jgi:hypothetical protein
MKLVIMQPYFFPYVGYFQLLHAADRFVVYDDVAFIKQGWINRNRILINGQASFITVPVKHATSFKPIYAIEIDDGPQNRQWRAKMLKSIANAYRRAPEFARVFPIVEAVIQSGVTQMADLARASLRAVADYLDLRCAWVESSRLYDNAGLTGQARVLDICRRVGATEYVNPPGGAELYSRDEFAAAGIGLHILRSHPIDYPQFGAPHVASLSIVDVLMFNSRDAARGLVAAYDLA